VPRPRGGGKKGRSGRRPFAIKVAAERIFNKFKLLDLAADIAAGDIWEQWTNKDGEIVSGPTKNGDRIAAIRFVADYAFGRPSQSVELTGRDGGAIKVVDDTRTALAGRIAGIASRLGTGGMVSEPHANGDHSP